MATRTKVVIGFMIAVFWIASLVATAAIAQTGQPAVPQPPLMQPEVFVGVDFGFRISHYRGEIPVGVVVIKKDSKWVPVEFDSGMKVIK